MGCFGDMEPVKQTDSTSTVSPPAWVNKAGKENYQQARGILDQGYVPYGGDRVANLSSDEVAAGNIVRNAATGGNPYQDEAEGLLRSYGSAPGYQFDWNSVIDENGPLGSIQGYMNPYLQQALDPTLRAINLQGAKQRQGIDSAATMSGAFGDARHGVVEGEQLKNENQLVADTTGKGWADAFAQALGMRTSDLQRLMQTQTSQAAENNTTLNRARTSGIDLTNLDKYGVSRDLGLAAALGSAGETGRGIEQKKKDTDYEEYLRRTGWTDNQIAFLTSILKGSPMPMTTTGSKTESAPNNTGWSMVGSLAGTGVSAAAKLLL